jgi:hypothetical protein
MISSKQHISHALTGYGVSTHLVVVLPSPKADGYPNDISSAESNFGAALDYCKPDRLTLLKAPYEGHIEEGVPSGIRQAIESRGWHNLAESTEVLKILAIDPYAHDWNPSEFFLNYFEPLLKGLAEDERTVFFVGPGSAFLTVFMTQMAFSVGAELISNTPFDNQGVRSAKSLAFAAEGAAGYRQLVDGKPLGEMPRKKTSMPRNALVKLLEKRSFNGRWSTARSLSGGSNLPDPLGFSQSAMTLSGLIKQRKTDDGVKYTLTPAGLVAAIETRRHHLNCFDSLYQGDALSLPEPVTGAHGVIAGLRTRDPDSPFEEERCNEYANGAENFDPVALVISHVSDSASTSFSVFPSPTGMTKVFNQRGKDLISTARSICGPDWDPQRHFVNTMDWFLSLPQHDVEWHLDVTGMTSQDQVVLSLLCHLLGIPIIYRSRKEGTGARGMHIDMPEGTRSPSGLHQHRTPIHSVWRSISDLIVHGSLDEEVEAVLESIVDPGQLVSKQDYDAVVNITLARGEQARSRVESKLLRDGLFARASLSGGTRGRADASGWVLTLDGRIVLAFMRAWSER